MIPFRVYQHNLNGLSARYDELSLVLPVNRPEVCLFQELYKGGHELSVLKKKSMMKGLYSGVFGRTGRAAVWNGRISSRRR